MLIGGAGLSRWTMAHFGCALASFVLAQTLAVTGVAYPEAPLQALPTFAAVHLLTIGWLSTLMFGALYQFVPVITGVALPAQRVPLLTLIATQVGLAGLLAGFLAPIYGFDHARLCLPVGGTLVAAGLGGGAVFLLAVIRRAEVRSLPIRFVATGLGFLVLTLALGLCFSLALALPGAPGWLVEVLRRGLDIHVVIGLGGWFTLTAMGVGYRLLSMFILAPEEETSSGRWAFRLSAGGMALVMAAGLAAPDAARDPAMDAAGAAVAAGIGIYLLDMVRLFRHRQRRELELNSRAAVGALAALAVAVVVAVGAHATGRMTELAGPLGYLAIFGWLSGLSLGQLYKIVPFLTWLERYGSQLGKGRVPRVQDLVDERRAAPWFLLYGLAVAGGTAAGLIGQDELWRAFIAAHLLATLAIVRELWRARHREPALSSPPLPRPFPTATTPGGVR